MEIWKKIEGFDNYEVSNYGRVKSLARVVNCVHNSQSNKVEKILRPQIDNRGNGYKVVVLYQNLMPRRWSVHRLVARAFIPNPENKPQVNHIDFDTRNNMVSNLEWVTAKENIHHRFRYGSGKTRGNLKEWEKQKLSKQFSKSVFLLNVHTNEKIHFEQRHKAAEFLGTVRSSVSNALKNGNLIKGKYKALSVE